MSKKFSLYLVDEFQNKLSSSLRCISLVTTFPDKGHAPSRRVGHLNFLGCMLETRKHCLDSDDSLSLTIMERCSKFQNKRIEKVLLTTQGKSKDVTLQVTQITKILTMQ